MSLQNYEKQTILFGPWGGHDGFHWDDGAHFTIKQLEISHGLGIDSIRIEYDNNGRSVWSERHGGSGGSRYDKVRLDYPDEYLTSCHGYYGSLQEPGPTIVRSLTFESNKRTYGPFGVEKGTYFTLPNTNGKIVGFLGKCGWYLDAVGLYFEPFKNHIASNNAIYSPHQYVDPFQKPIASNNAIYSPHQYVDPFQKPIASNNAIYTSHQYSFTHGKETYDYSMIQGSLGPNYDLIVALRQKDDQKTARPFTPHVEPKNEKFDMFRDIFQIPGLTPGKIERVPSKNAATPHAAPKNEVSRLPPNKIERVPSEHAAGVVTYGPWGGTGGSLFDDGIYDGIRQIVVSRNVAITSIRVCYEQNGQPLWGSKNGGTGSFKSDKVILDYPSEILTHITGYHGPAMKMGPEVIKSLTFHTTKGKHGPYGEEQGEFFSTKLREGSVILGIHGRKGLFVDAIGVHVLEGKILPFSTSPSKDSVVSSISNHKQSPSNPPTKTINQTALSTQKVDHSQWPFKVGKRGQSEEVAQKLVKDPAPYGPGPWGGDGGKPWDDGVFTGIKQIILTITDAICCIEIEYDRNGQSVWSVKHGGSGGQTANRVKLDYPHEVLTCVSGYYGPIKKEPGPKLIHSLTFHTTRRKYGPFGEELGTYFASGTTEGKVVGFHGRSSMYLDAIGVHMQHWLGNQKHKPSVMKMFT